MVATILQIMIGVHMCTIAIVWWIIWSVIVVVTGIHVPLAEDNICLLIWNDLMNSLETETLKIKCD